MRKVVTVKSFQSIEYLTLWRVLSYKNGCDWKLKELGFIKEEVFESIVDEVKKHFRTSSISTKLTSQPEFSMEVFDAAEVAKVNIVYEEPKIL